MNLSVDIQVADNDNNHPPPAHIEHWVSTAIGNRLPEAQLSLRLVSEQEITALNAQYRGQAKTTNVLSFPADLPDYIDEPLLGDLIICSAVVEREAKEQHKPSTSHWAHMVVHGTLHLLGYDHIEDNEAHIMENLEITILNSLGIANPYISDH